MKAFIRSRFVQGVLAVLTWAYLWLVLRTVRWTHVDQDMAERELALDRAAIGCIWHGTIPMAIAAKAVIGKRPSRILISLSADGEFITRAIALHGLTAIRGSSAKKGAKAKGGAAALRECLDWLANRGLLLVTPDGPRGPARKMTLGVMRMARLSQAPVFMLGLAAKPVKTLNSWDRTQLPRPFGRGAVTWNGPFTVPSDADDDQLQRLCETWAEELDAAGARALAALA